MLKAILFDLDGTLTDTDPLHFKLWKEILQSYDIEIDHPFYKANISGGQNPEIIKNLIPQLSVEEGVELADSKEARFRESAEELQPLAGLMEMLDWIETTELRKAVITNAPRENAKFMLETLHLTPRFEFVVLGEDMIAGKPDPAPYKYGLEKMQIQPSEAIVFEDSPSGIRSAVGAGIYTIGVATTHEPSILKAVGASMIIQDFNDVQMWAKIQSLLGTEKTVQMTE
ncbi:MAG: HAD-IA family hydrolase [Cyanobacteria bacterium J06592_8]